MGLFGVMNKACVAAFMDREDDQGVVTIRRGSGPAVSVPAIFDASYYAADDGEFASVDLVTTISVRIVDAPGVAVDDLVTARGQNFRVRERRPDSEGMIVLELEKA